MNNKQLYTIFGGLFIVIVGGLIFWNMRSDAGADTVAEPTPTPTPVYKEVDDSVEAELSLSANQRFVDMTISGLDGQFESLEYELSYDTDKGPKGSIGRVSLTSGQDEVVREVELGTCSTGGTCTYHTGVENFTLIVKFKSVDGETFILRENFDEL